MPLVSFHRISKYYGAQAIIQDVSWGIDAGHHVGLIGENGVGKTTILKLITRELEPDGGEINRQNGCNIGYLTQDPLLDPACLLLEAAIRGLTSIHGLGRELKEVERALEQAPENGSNSERLLARYGRLQEAYDRAGGYTYQHRAEAVLYGLGFSESDLSLPVGVLSGGQKTRLGLAKLLLGEADLLLLDEPESHLDMEATEWLERYVKDYRGAILLVSHDRYFLDRTVNQVVELEHHTLSAYPGNYSKYLTLKEERSRVQNRQYAQQQQMIDRTEDFIRRHLAGQKTKQAQGRRNMLERLERIDRPTDATKTAGFNFSKVTRTGNEVVIIDRVSKRYEDRTLFTDLSFLLRQGERVGIIGPNGCGKTTLLRMILEQEQPTDGSVRLGASVRVGYYDQERGGLSRNRSVINELWSVRPTMTEEMVRNELGRFLFSGDDVFRSVSTLSGGEQGRLTLAKLILDEPNLLILDEPTNHLDISSRHVLEQALQVYPGTILVVSHDRYFLDRVARELLIFEPEGIVRWTGNYSSYRAYREQQAEDDAAVDEERSTKKSKGKTRQNTDPAIAQKKRWQKSVDTLEAGIQAKESEVSKLEQDLNDEKVFTDPVKVTEAGRAYTQATEELEALYKEWETLTQEIEQL